MKQLVYMPKCLPSLEIEKENLKPGNYWLNNSPQLDGYGEGPHAVLIREGGAKDHLVLFHAGNGKPVPVEKISGSFYGPIYLLKGFSGSKIFISDFNESAGKKIYEIARYIDLQEPEERSRLNNNFVDKLSNIDRWPGSVGKVILFDDPAPLSLYFEVRRNDSGKCVTNGGIIFHDSSNEWSIHT